MDEALAIVCQIRFKAAWFKIGAELVSMLIMDIHDVKIQFLQLVDTVMDGEEIVILKAGKPVARLVSIALKKTLRRFGVLEGKMTISEDFDAPFSEGFLNSFEDPL